MKREEILVNCIDDIQAGKCSLEECTGRYPELAGELRALVGIASKINCEAATPSAEFRQRARRRLVEVMKSTEAEHSQAWSWPRLLFVRKLGYAFVTAALVLAIGSSGVVYASQNSLPSDRLYPVKTGAEKVQLALTLSPQSKASLHLKLAERRIEEVLTESVLKRNISVSALEAVATQIDLAISGISRIPADEAKVLLTQLSQSTLNQQVSLEQVSRAVPEPVQPALRQALDATRLGNLIAQVASGNPSFLGTGASVRDEKLESAYFELEATLLGVEGGTWNVGGILLRNVNIHGRVPAVGSGVKLKGVVRANEVFISKAERREKALDEIKVKGIFSGSNASGTVWYVGGVPVGELHNVTLPSVGSRLEIKGTVQNGIFTIREMEGKRVETGESKFGGVLQKVDPAGQTIVVDMAGAKVTLNISGATIQDEDGRTLAPHEMESTIGKDIQASAIYKSNDQLFAKNITVDTGRKPEESKGKPGESKGKPDESKGKPGESRSKPKDGRD